MTYQHVANRSPAGYRQVMTTPPEITRETNGLTVSGTGDLVADLGLEQYREHLQLAAEIRHVVGPDPADEELAAIVRGQVKDIPVERLRELARDLLKAEFARVQESMAREMGDALPRVSSEDEADEVAREWTSSSKA